MTQASGEFLDKNRLFFPFTKLVQKNRPLLIRISTSICW